MRKGLLFGAAGAAALVIVVVVIIAMRGGGSSVAAATTTTSATSTTEAPPPPSTTVAEALQFSFEGELPEVEATVEALYRWLAEPSTPPPPDLPAWLAEAGAAAAPVDQLRVEAQTHWAPLKYGQRVAVVLAGDDAVLVADEANGWRIVGAKLPSFGLPALYGPERRAVLIIGSDARWQEDALRARADSLHIVTAVPAEGAGAIVGIPRDSWVTSITGARSKVNGILSALGPEGLTDSISRLSGVEFEGYLLTGFLGFEVMMRNFGPLSIDLPNPIRGGLSGFPDFPAGPQDIVAEDLLLLARIRKTLPNGDFGRSANHGLIMQAGLSMVQQRGMADLPNLIAILEDSTNTDLSAGALLSLGATAFEIDPGRVANTVIPGRVGTVGAASVVFIGGGADAVFADVADDSLLNAQPEG